MFEDIRTIIVKQTPTDRSSIRKNTSKTHPVCWHNHKAVAIKNRNMCALLNGMFEMFPLYLNMVKNAVSPIIPDKPQIRR